jgi:hypothetical protein
MFSPVDIAWDGDPATLTDRQLDQLIKYFEQIALGGDEGKIEAIRRRAMLAAGVRVDLEPTSESSEAPAEAVPTQDGW